MLKKIALITGFVLCLSPLAAATNTVAQPGVTVLTLDECVRLALEKNRDYLMAQQDVKIKEAAAAAAYGNFFPTIKFTTTTTVLDPQTVSDGEVKFPSTASPTGYIPLKMVYSPLFTMGLSATYAIPHIPFFSDGAFGLANAAHELTLRDLDAARNKLTRSRADIKAAVSKAFYQTRLAELAFDLAKANDERLKTYLNVAERNFAAGRVSKYELLRAQVQSANNKPELVKTENNVRLSRISLLQQLALGLDTEIKVLGKLETEFLDFGEERALATALSNRTELRDVKIAEDVASLQKDVASYGGRPQLAAFANYNWELKKPSTFSTEDRSLTSSWNAGLQLSIPISELLNPASKTWQSVDQYDQAVKKARLQRDNVETLIRLELRQSFLRLEENRKTIAAQKVAVELSTEGLRMGRIAYGEGQLGNAELMDAELDYQRAQLLEYQSWYGYIAAKIDLQKAMGIY